MTLLPGGTATFVVTAHIKPDASATAAVSNRATVSTPAGDTTPADNTSTDTLTLSPHADLSIKKTDSVGGTFNSTTNNTTGGSIVPGQDNTVVYTIVVSNSGPSTAVGQTVTDSDLTSITGWVSDSWTASASSGSSVTTASGNGNISDTVTLLPGGTATFVVTAHIKPDASATAAVSNRATVSTPAGDTTPADNTSTDTLTLSPHADLSIKKTDSVGGTFNSTTNNTTGGSIVPGQDNTVVYTIVVSNSGPSTAVGQTVTDSDLTSITGWVSDSWTASASSGSSVTTASGNGNISDTVTLLPGGTATFVVTAHIKPDASATAAVSNRATVSTPAGDTTPADNTSTDTLTLSPHADLSIKKTDSVGGTFNSTTNNTTGGSIVPGQDNTVVYTIVVSNSGPSTAVGQTVTDSDLTSITGWVSDSWTASASSGSSVTTASGNGNISDTVTLLPGGTATFIVTAHIKPDASATAAVSNRATVSTPAGDTTPADNTSTDTLTLSPHADLSIKKTDSVGGTFNSTTNNTTGGSIVPGQDNTVVYTIVVSNSGPSTAVGQTVTDSDLTSIPGWVSDSWTAAASGSSSVTTASGNGNISDTVTLLPGGTATFVVTAHIKPDASATAAVSNRATVSTPTGDTTPADNTSTDTLTLSPHADLSIKKTDSVGGTFNSTTNNTTGGSIVPGQDNTVVYTIVVSNSGPSTAVGQTVTDSDLTSITGWVSDSWTASASSGSSVTTASGNGNISDTVTLLPGGTATFVVTAHIKPDASATAAVSNRATVSTPAGDTTPADNTSTDTLTLSPHADLSIKKTDSVGGTFNSTTNNTTGGSIVPGQDNTVVYTIVVSNSGPSTAVGQTVTDSDLTSITGWVSDSWTASASSGSSVTTASGNGNISDTVTLLPGGTATFVVTAHIKPDASATAAVSNRATVSTPAGDTTPADNTSTDTLTLSPHADLSIKKTDSVGGTFNSTTNNTTGGSIVPGQDNTVVYTIVVSNSGPSTAVGQTVTDSDLTSITGWVSDSWTASASSGSSVTTASGNGNISDTVTLLPGGTATFVVTAHIKPDASATAAVSNTATVSTPTGDTTTADNTSTDTLTLTSAAPLLVTTTIKDASGGTVTGVLGESVKDTATVTGSRGLHADRHGDLQVLQHRYPCTAPGRHTTRR